MGDQGPVNPSQASMVPHPKNENGKHSRILRSSPFAPKIGVSGRVFCCLIVTSIRFGLFKSVVLFSLGPQITQKPSATFGDLPETRG